MPLDKILRVSLFAIAMAFIESAVVVYLREIYYPEGFAFPLAPIDLYIAITELLREAATIIMLLVVGWITGKNFTTRFAYFIYAFAIWDIYYYIFLKMVLGWPENLLTWDILFLIPVTWVGPVIAPVMLSFTMIFLAVVIIWFNKNETHLKMSWTSWSLLILGSFIVITAFCMDYTQYVTEQYALRDVVKLSGDARFLSYISSYVPRKFNWLVFLAGEGILLAGVLWYMLKKRPG